jgi:hypothetical protein
MLLSVSAHLQTAAFFFSLICPEERCKSLLHNNGNYVTMYQSMSHPRRTQPHVYVYLLQSAHVRLAQAYISKGEIQSCPI